jgi:hypothetical protein
VPNKYSKIFAAMLLATAFAANASAHEHHAAPALPAASSVAGNEQPVPLAAHYTLRVNKLQTDWFLWRQNDLIETANVLAAEGTIWQRLDNDAGYYYRRVFHKDERVVEYAPGELKARHTEPEWQKLASVISPKTLEALRRVGDKPMFGQRAAHYVGRLDGQKIDLWWLETARLPARLHVVSAGRQMHMELREMHAGSPDTWPAAWPRTNEQKLAAYGLIDASDFGDMESDPFVAKVMQVDGHEHGHAH